MGRKPNQLILEFFERGAKLQDSSNRYVHKCKLCGETNPKGRIDSLQHHIVKKCPAISTEDRRRAVLQIHNLADNAENAQALQLNGPPVELSHSGSNWTALETLAEVSRQVVMTEKHDDRGIHNNSDGSLSKLDDQPRIDRFELHEQWTPDNPPLSYDARLQHDKRGHKRSQNARGDNESDALHPDFSNNGPGSSPELHLSLDTATSMAAAAAVASARFALDPQLLGDSVLEVSPQTALSTGPELPNSLQVEYYDNKYATPDQGAWPNLDSATSVAYPEQDESNNIIEQQGHVNGLTRPIASSAGMRTEFSAEFGNGQKSTKPKVRGRFTPDRRREVQNVRKQGACLRCRMLKKPCSDGTPCVTCRRVESARLWKQPCVRRKLEDILEMYTAGLHSVLAHREIQNTKAAVVFAPSGKQVDVTHYPEETAIFATFATLEGQAGEIDQNIDPGLGDALISEFSNPRLLDGDTTDLPPKIEGYVKAMSTIFFEKEPSHFMKVTLLTAHDMAIERNDSLLRHALNLWAVVHVLIDHELKWSVFEKPNLVTGMEGVKIPEGNSYQLLCMQLSAAVEKTAATVSKTVLAQLENRLLQRHDRRAGFATFLTTIILLNCIEKSAWLYDSWEQDILRPNWPLEKAPEIYSAQGETVTEMLQSLLRVRSVSPKTFGRQEDGILTSAAEDAKEYFQRLNLTYADVVQKKDHPVFDPSDSRCYELRFCSRIILPEA